MATLTLKKPVKTSVPAAQLPTEDLIGKFAVMRQAYMGQNMKFSACHATREAAEAEADRLAKLKKLRFFVVEIIHGVGTQSVAKEVA